ncbi:MAG TPA: hypothetical protein VGM27_14005 [Acidobacteriaceae bacterium]
MSNPWPLTLGQWPCLTEAASRGRLLGGFTPASRPARHSVYHREWPWNDMNVLSQYPFDPRRRTIWTLLWTRHLDASSLMAL